MTDTKDTVSTLERRLDPSEISKRQGRGGTKLRYASYPAVVRRLNEAFGVNWDFTVSQPSWQEFERKMWVTVKVTITARSGDVTVTKESWGAEDLMNGDVDAAIKGAQSFAIRKCASYFGIGLHLWDDDDAKHDHLANTRNDSQTQPQVKNNGPITQKQMSMIHAIAGKLGMPKEYLDTMVQESDKYPDANRVSELDKVSASAIIKWLDGKQKEAG